MFIQDVRLKGDNENRQKAQFVYNMQLTCTTTFTKQLTCCCLEMSEIEIMLFRKRFTAWLQITRTLKKMLAEATYNFSCCNAITKITYPQVGNIPFGQCKSSAEIFQAETCTKSCEDRTELINLFDRSTNQPLFSVVLFSTDTLISLVHHLFNHVTFLHGYTATTWRREI